jgi:hypothetical protein
MTVTEDMLVAYADGEIDEVGRRRVEQAMAADPALADRIAAHMELRSLISGHYAPVAEEPVPDRFTALLSEGSKVVDIGEARTRRQRRWPVFINAAAIAATLVIGVVVGRGMAGPQGPVGVSGGTLVAQGALADALDTQLAANQPGDATVRIGLTFRAADGRWCRSFEEMAVAGVACRHDGGWRLEQAVPGRAQAGAYRQASGGDERIAQAVGTIISGDAADAATERAARDAGWR